MSEVFADLLKQAEEAERRRIQNTAAVHVGYGLFLRLADRAHQVIVDGIPVEVVEGWQRNWTNALKQRKVEYETARNDCERLRGVIEDWEERQKLKQSAEQKDMKELIRLLERAGGEVPDFTTLLHQNPEVAIALNTSDIIGFYTVARTLERLYFDGIAEELFRRHDQSWCEIKRLETPQVLQAYEIAQQWVRHEYSVEALQGSMLERTVALMKRAAELPILPVLYSYLYVSATPQFRECLRRNYQTILQSACEFFLDYVLPYSTDETLVNQLRETSRLMARGFGNLIQGAKPTFKVVKYATRYKQGKESITEDRTDELTAKILQQLGGVPILALLLVFQDSNADEMEKEAALAPLLSCLSRTKGIRQGMIADVEKVFGIEPGERGKGKFSAGIFSSLEYRHPDYPNIQPLPGIARNVVLAEAIYSTDYAHRVVEDAVRWSKKGLVAKQGRNAIEAHDWNYLFRAQVALMLFLCEFPFAEWERKREGIRRRARAQREIYKDKSLALDTLQRFLRNGTKKNLLGQFEWLQHAKEVRAQQIWSESQQMKEEGRSLTDAAGRKVQGFKGFDDFVCSLLSDGDWEPCKPDKIQEFLQRHPNLFLELSAFIKTLPEEERKVMECYCQEKLANPNLPEAELYKRVARRRHNAVNHKAVNSVKQRKYHATIKIRLWLRTKGVEAPPN